MLSILEINLLFWSVLITIGTLFAIFIVLFVKYKKRYTANVRSVYSFKQPYKQEHIDFTVFLIGDMGALPVNNTDNVANFLKLQLKEAGRNSAIIFLGDNAYPRGLYEKTHHKRKLIERRLNAQLDIVKDHPGRVIFLSGNHDWNKGRRGGWEYVLRQEQYINSYLNRGKVFLPESGCPGPLSIELKPYLQLLILNTQWWPQDGARPIGEQQGCRAHSKEHFFQLLHHDLQECRDKKILVAAHHPLYSYSAHGGKFHYKHHIFPLRSLHKKIYLPLPVLGSLYPLYRKIYGAREDISHPAYKKLRRRLLAHFQLYPNLIYAAGHDHNLQYIKKRQLHHIISGSGSKTSYVGTGKSARFTSSERGYFKINYMKNGEVFIECWIPEEDGRTGILAYVAEAD